MNHFISLKNPNNLIKIFFFFLTVHRTFIKGKVLLNIVKTKKKLLNFLLFENGLSICKTLVHAST